MRGVSKGYGSGVTRSEILNNINLNVREGEFLAVVGFSGSGKTTFTQLLAGLIKPDVGEITMEGKPRSRGPVQIADWFFKTTRCCLG